MEPFDKVFDSSTLNCKFTITLRGNVFYNGAADKYQSHLANKKRIPK